MKLYIVLVLASALSLHAASVAAQTDTSNGPPQAPSQQPASPPTTKQQPSDQATAGQNDLQARSNAAAILNATAVDVQTGGVRAVSSHVTDIKNALSEGAAAFAMSPSADGTLVVPTDGLAEMLIAMAVAKKVPGANHVVAVANPYPMLSLYLGSYYNDIGKFEDAARVLGEGLKLFAVSD